MMMGPSAIYGQSLALLTDLYQLTMAYGYWKAGEEDTEAVFHLYFRSNPFGGGYAVGCGLAHVVDLLESWRFDEDDVTYLAGLKGNDGRPLFERAFLDHLASMELEVDVDAVEEGEVVFPHEPLVRVRGPILQCQLLETPLLNVMNFQTLIATKAARIVRAARGEPVLEFGLRRAQGMDGGLAASRAGYVGGVAATSNVLAGKLFGIPVRGTHAHSWVMCFDTELESFERYAETMPNNCIFLVDTFDTLEGVRRACDVGDRLRARGYEMVGVRLDSGDLAWLSQQAREILDERGFDEAQIVASNSLDEHLITSLKEQDAKITVWAVGTRLVTAHDQPALGGVYKLAAVRRCDGGGRWERKVKLSEQAAKVSTPGVLGVRRHFNGQEYVGDMIYDEEMGIGPHRMMIDPMDPTRRKLFDASTAHRELLQPIFRAGSRVYDVPDLHAARARAAGELDRFHGGITRLVHPHQYPVGLEVGLHELKTRLILQARGFHEPPLHRG